MTLPLRGPSVISGNEVSGLPELYETYGKLIGHRYTLHDAYTRKDNKGFANISVLEACATRFEGGSLQFEMSHNHDGLDLVILSFAMSGQILCYRQNGIECEAAPGGAILHTTVASLHARAGHDGSVIAVALPRKKLCSLLAKGDDLSIRALPVQNAALSLFVGHARNFLSLRNVPDSALAQLVGDQLCDLAAVAIGVNARGKEKVLDGHALHDARHGRAVAYIARHLANPGLGEGDIARYLGLSPSSVRQIFARKQSTVARTIRNVRLEMAASILLDETQHNRKIVGIAFDCGFRSLSAFYEAFRERYDCHPTDLKASATAHTVRD